MKSRTQVTPRYLRTKQAAIYLGIGMGTLRQLAQDGKIRFTKFNDSEHSTWHFKVDDLDALMERHSN